MARIKKYSPEQKLSSFQTFIIDDNPNSDYFRITEFKDTFTGGKNGFLIEGSEYLKESTEIKIELLDVNGDPIYYEPGNGVPEYYEGISKLVAVYIYEDTPIGLGKITILGELKQYDDNGVKRDIPEQWKAAYNVKWERTFQINKNLANEDKVRFYRRPKVAIDEIVKPIFSKTPNTINQTGTINGTPLVPNAGSKLSSFSLPTSYRITTTDDSYWTGSVVGQTLNVSSLNYSPTITDVVSKTELVVDPPYAPNNVVSSFSGENYSVDFVYVEGAGDLATALTGSFAKINITDMKTFVGDAARIKVFRRSQSQLSDYEFVQDIQLESTELLKDIETVSVNEEYYGNFTDANLESYWVTSSNDITLEFNQNFLYNSAKLSSTNTENFFTTQSFGISPGVEYNLSFNVRKESNISGDDYIRAFLSGSYNGTAKSQTITTINSSNSVLQKTNVSENIIADNIQTASLYFEVVGDGWYINNVSLKAAQETAFSPDEITFIQQVPKTLPSETFDYRFEFYDINNNYIPVLVEKTKTFDGGNLNLFEKSIELIPDQLYFAFDSASNPLPPTIINFDVVTTLVTGSVNYTSQSFDFFGNELSASEFAGGQYPGLLRDIRTDNPFLTVSDFTGSRDDLTVQYVRYTAEVEGVSDTVIITRVQDGQGGVNFEIRPYRGTVIKNKSDKDLEIQAIRIDGVNEIVLKENLPQAGFSDAKLRVLSSSLDPITSQPSGSYILLSEASSSKFIRGLNAGTTGSGEINYNATFNRDAITNELVVFLMDGEDSGSILTSIILTDTLDGLGSGFVKFSAEQFSLQPRLDTEYNPTTASVTASFQDRFSPLAESFISGCLMITPSASIDDDFVTHYYMFYETGTFDRRVSVSATDLLDNPVYSGIPGQSVNFYSALETKQLTFNFTYLEDITSASVSVDKTFYIVPEGKPGDDAIVIDIEPRIVQLSANQRGAVYDYGPLDTDISVKQGRLDLVYNSTKKAGTFDIISTLSTNVSTGSIKPKGDISASLEGYSGIPNPILSASVKYDLEIHPYFTSSYFTQSVFQKITKAIDGASGVDLFINPIAVNFTGDEDGNINDYAAGNTTLIVKQGDEYLTFDAANTGTPGTFTCSLDERGIQVGQISASARFVPEYGDDTLHFLQYDQMPYTTASVDYNLTIYPFSLSNGVASGSIDLTRTQIFSKAVAGKRARSVKLNSTSRQIVYDGDGVVVAPEGSVILSVDAIAFTGSGFYQFFKDGYPYSLIDDSPEFEISSGDTVGSGEVATWKVEARDGSPYAGVIATDELTISGVKNGGDGYTIELSNPNPTVAVEVDGTTDLSNTGTTIRAFKSNGELTNVSSYSSPTLDGNGDPIGSLGEFSASLYSTSAFITQNNIPTGNPATVGAISNWNSPITNLQGEVVFKVDIENGRAVFFKTQSLSVSLEGAVGPGIVMRGEWTGSLDYLYNEGRRDAVFREINGDVHYWATYSTLADAGSPPYTYEPEYDELDPPGIGDVDANGWEYLGIQDFFVAAKMAIFEESFIKNTVNIGVPPVDNPNALITLDGSDDEPYIAIGQTGVRGFQQPGVFIGMTNDGGPIGSSGTFGIMSLVGVPDGGVSYNSLEWDGEVLTIRGAIRQTAAGVREPSLRGAWQDGTQYYTTDLVTYNGQSWTADSAHTSDSGGGASDGPPGTGPWTAASGTGKTVTLSSDNFVITYDANGNNPSPSGNVKLMASSSNFIDPYFKFTGGITGGDEATYTNGADGNYDSATFTVPSTIFTTPLQFRVGVSDADQNEVVSDIINVFAIQPGADSTPMYFITSIAGGTQIKNSSGTIELQVQKSDSTGLSDITSGTDARIYDGGTLLAAQTGVTDGGNGVAYNPIIASSFINGTKTLLLKDNGGNVLDSITLLDVTDGLGGGSFISPNLSTNRDTSTNVYTPTFLSLTASFYDTSGTEYTKAVRITPNYASGTDYMYYDNDAGAHTDSQITLTLDDGDGTTFGGTGVGNKLPTKDVVVTAVFTDPATGQTNTIVETVYIVSDGVDGIDAITVISTNQAHTLPADSGGNVSSYAGSGTTISVYEGTTQLDYDGTGTSDGKWTVSATPTDITTGTITDSGNDAVVGNHSSMNATQASISYSISGKRSNGDSFTASTIQTLTKAVAGESGTSGVNGTNGAAGTPAGVVYAGEWASDGTYSDPNVYLAETQLKYVVKYSGNYYVCATTHEYNGTWSTSNGYAENDVVKEGSTYYIANSATAPGDTAPSTDPGEWDQIGSSITPGVWTSGWTSFGAQFTSVATDILFAEDVYANQTINIGTDDGSPVIALNADAPNYDNPFISIGQKSPNIGFDENGIFIGYKAGSPVLSFVTSSANLISYFKYESGSIQISDARFNGSGSVIEGSQILVGETSPGSGEYNFRVDTDGNVFAKSGSFEGTIVARDGAIGAWVVDENAITSENSQVELNATDEFIEIRNSSLVPKVMLNTDATLFSPGSAASVTFNSPAGGYYNANSAESFTAYGTGNHGTISTTTITTRSSTFSVSTTGVYSIVFEPTPNKSYVEATGEFCYLTATTTMNLREGSATGTITAQLGVYTATAWGYDSGGGGLSVVGNTKLTLSDGTTILAKDITKEHKILAWDEVNGKYTEATISKVHSRSVDSTFRVNVGGKVVEVSDSHGFWLDGGKQIKVNDIIAGETKIYVKNGEGIELSIVDSVEEIFGEEMVYTLTVPQYVNYLSNDIISHNIAGSYYPETDRQYYPATTKSKTVSLTAGTTYYLTFETKYSGNVNSQVSQDFYNLRGVEFSIDVESNNLVGQSTNAGTEINDAGFQVASGDERVFRADTTTTAGDPWITQIGGTRVDYFVPRYSISPSGAGYPKSYGQSNTVINYQDPAYPLTRAMCRVEITNSGPAVTAKEPKINVASVTRSGAGIYIINLQDALSDWDGVAMVSAYGRWQSTSPYYNNLSAGDNEYTHNIGVNASNANGGSPSVTVNFKDNNSDTDRDPYVFYFVMFG